MASSVAADGGKKSAASAPPMPIPNGAQTHVRTVAAHEAAPDRSATANEAMADSQATPVANRKPSSISSHTRHAPHTVSGATTSVSYLLNDQD